MHPYKSGSPALSEAEPNAEPKPAPKVEPKAPEPKAQIICVTLGVIDACIASLESDMSQGEGKLKIVSVSE